MSQERQRIAKITLDERTVVLKHALKGAILPVVSFLGPAAAGIMTGSFVVETMFAVPGMGRWFVNGALGQPPASVPTTSENGPEVSEKRARVDLAALAPRKN